MSRGAGIACVLLLATSPVPAMMIYDATVFPEAVRFQRAGTFDAERWLDDGWFYQHVELGIWDPPLGERDSYQRDLSEFQGDAFFIEWRMVTDAPVSEVTDHNGGVLMVLAGGPVQYHMNLSNGRIRFIRGVQYPVLYFDIAPDVPHTYRLEVFRDQYYRLTMDGAALDSGVPEADWPKATAAMSFGSRSWEAEHTTSWDYVTFGSLPEPGCGVLLLAGCVLLFHHRRA